MEGTLPISYGVKISNILLGILSNTFWLYLHRLSNLHYSQDTFIGKRKTLIWFHHVIQNLWRYTGRKDSKTYFRFYGTVWYTKNRTGTTSAFFTTYFTISFQVAIFKIYRVIRNNILPTNYYNFISFNSVGLLFHLELVILKWNRYRVERTIRTSI